MELLDYSLRYYYYCLWVVVIQNHSSMLIIFPSWVLLVAVSLVSEAKILLFLHTSLCYLLTPVRALISICILAEQFRSIRLRPFIRQRHAEGHHTGWPSATCRVHHKDHGQTIDLSLPHGSAEVGPDVAGRRTESGVNQYSYRLPDTCYGHR